VLLGATLKEPFMGLARDPLVATEAGLGKETASALPRGLTHAFLEAPAWKRSLYAARGLRRDLEQWNATGAAPPRPRAVVFASDEAEASDLARRLRKGLWGDHAVAAFLPTTGEAPLVSAGALSRAGSEGDDEFSDVASRNAATVLVTVPSRAAWTSRTCRTCTASARAPTRRRTLGSAADRELAAQLEEVGAGAPEDLPAPPAPEGDRERLEETGVLL